METTAKIIRLQAENIKNIKAIDISTPTENVIKITGKNAAGKTSVLDCITMAIGGKDCIPADPIRHGESSARITLDCGEFIVERHWTDPDDLSKTYLKVAAGEGMQFSSPQTMLDKWVGQLSFDPLAFIRMSNKEQSKLVAQLTGFDYQNWQLRYGEIYTSRTALNRTLKEKQAQLKELPLPDPEIAPEFDDAFQVVEEIDISELIAQQEDMLSVIKANDKIRQAYEGQERVVGLLQQSVNNIKEQLFAAEDELATATEQLKAIANKKESLVDPDTEKLNQQINDAESINQKIRSAVRYNEKKSEVDNYQHESDELTGLLKKCEQEKVEWFSSADMPIPGLSIEERTDSNLTVCTYNGTQINMLSSAEQLKLSIQIAMALNPKLRVIRITDGSLLDSESMGIIEQMARENDYQIWIEAVDETGQVGIVIEEGEVAVNNYEGK